MEVAALGLRVDGSPVDEATASLNRFTSSADRAEKSATGMGRGADRAGKQASNANERASKSANRLAGSYGRVNTAVLTAARSMLGLVGAAVGLASGIRTLATFEQSMASVSAITRASAEELGAMRDIAKELGSTTEFSASQAAEGLRFLGMAGFSAAESIAAIPSVLNLATAAAIDLGSAADITSNIMSGFGIQAENAADVADVLAAASSRANTSVSQLGGAMSTVAPIASALNISLADTAAAIGVMSDAGIQGERAGTAMRGVLASLAGPTKAASEALAGLGLNVRDVDPAANDLATILTRLREAGLGTADAMTIFGREAASGALVLVEAADRVGEFGRELAEANGEASRMADTMRDQLGGDLQGVASAVEGLVIALGDAGLTAILRSVIQSITSAVRVITSLVNALASAGRMAGEYLAPAFALVKQYGDLALVALAGFYAPAVLAGIGTLTASVTTLSVSLSVGLVGAIRAVTAAMLANPIGLIVAGIAAATYAIYKFRDDISQVLGFDIVEAAKGAANFIAGAFVAAYENIDVVWNNFGDVIGAAVIGGVNVAIRLIDGLIQGAISGINVLIDAVNKIPGVDIGPVGQGVGIDQIANPYADRIIEERGQAIAEALSRDYIGEALRGSGSSGGGGGGTPPGAPGALPPPETIPLPGSGGTGEIDDNVKAIRSLTEELRLAKLEGEELAVEQAKLSLNEYATPDQIRQIEDLARSLYNLSEQQDIDAEAKKIAESLRTEEEAIRESYQRRRDIVLAATFENEQARTELLTRLEAERNEALLEINGSYWERWLAAAEENLSSFDELSRVVVENFTAQFGNAFEAMVLDSENFGDAMRGLAESLVRSVVNALGQMAAQWLAYQAVQLLVGKTTQASGALALIANAQATSAQAALSAYASTAAIPIVGPAAAPAAAAAATAATQPMVAAVSSAALAGIAHNGIDSIPREGTWLLDRGERVVDSRTNYDLKQYLGRQNNGGGNNETVVNVNEAPPGTRVNRSQVDGRTIIDVVVADINSNGPAFRSLAARTGLRRRGT